MGDLQEPICLVFVWIQCPAPISPTEYSFPLHLSHFFTGDCYFILVVAKSNKAPAALGLKDNLSEEDTQLFLSRPLDTIISCPSPTSGLINLVNP